jgi:hypothetical protein
VSTTAISSASPWTESKHRPSDCSSFADDQGDG